jgi:hypothetical protein
LEKSAVRHDSQGKEVSFELLIQSVPGACCIVVEEERVKSNILVLEKEKLFPKVAIGDARGEILQDVMLAEVAKLVEKNKS